MSHPLVPETETQATLSEWEYLYSSVVLHAGRLMDARDYDDFEDAKADLKEATEKLNAALDKYRESL
jgi:hypothetical protein